MRTVGAEDLPPKVMHERENRIMRTVGAEDLPTKVMHEDRK